jgi:hypothetical protein
VFPPDSPFSRYGPSLSVVGRGPGGSGSPVSGTMTVLRPLVALSARLLHSLAVPVSCPIFRITGHSHERPLPPLEHRGSLGCFYSACPQAAHLLPETSSSLTFPYDLLRICPAHGSRPRRPARITRERDHSRFRDNESLLATRKISELDHTASALAVYASHTTSPWRMQNSLPVACWAFPGGVRADFSLGSTRS